MPRIGRKGAGIGAASALLLLGGIGPAYAEHRTLQQCLDEAVNHNGELPTCTKVNGTWVPSWPGDPGSSGGGISGGFVLLVVLAILLGIGALIWKVVTAQKLARQSGMDPGLATQMTLLTEDGLDATYLAANSRGSRAPESASSATQQHPRSDAAARLTELRSLLDQGLLTPDEYQERRKAILDEV